MLLRRRARPRKGQALLEYALLITGVALVSLVAVSILGHKIGEMIGTTAAVLPGAHTDDNAPLVVGQLVETTLDHHGHITLDVVEIMERSRTNRLGNNLFGHSGAGLGHLVDETN